jgi:hypothetical protein
MNYGIGESVRIISKDNESSRKGIISYYELGLPTLDVIYEDNGKINNSNYSDILLYS